MTQSLGNKAFSSLRWNYFGLLVRSASSFVIGIILAHLLGPKPFGQIAIALLVWGLANQLAEGGFSAAIVHSPELTEEQVRFAFTIQILIAGGFAAALVLVAPWIAISFHDPGMKNVLRAMAPLFVLQSLGQTSTGLLKRRLAFRSVQIAQVTSYLVAYACIGVPTAFLGGGVWSLVAAQLTQALLNSVHVYLLVRHSILPCLSRTASGLTGYGTKVVGTNLANWGISNLDNATVGAVFGPVSLGLYSRAFNVVSFVVDGVTGACQQVLFSAYSRTQNQLATVRRIYLVSVAFVTIILFPVFCVISACAQTVIVGLYGSKWASAGPMLRPLALAMAISAMMALGGPVLWGTNHVQNELRAQVLTLIVAVLAFLVSSRLSVIALAWAVVAIYCARWFLVGKLVWRLLGVGFRDLVRMTRGGITLAAVATTLCFWIDKFFTRHGVRSSFALGALVLSGVIIWLSVIILSGGRIVAIELLEAGAGVSEHLPPILVRFIRRAISRQLADSSVLIDSAS